jgi:hypothetical protein
MHSCVTASGGGKFYSSTFPDTTAQAEAHIDRAIIIVKNWSGTENPNGDEQIFLGRITGVNTADEYFSIQLTDEAGSPVPGGINSGDVLLVKAETDATMHEIAHEVWEESVLDHSTDDTFGMFNRIMAGLCQYNHRVLDPQYDLSGRLTACRLAIYASAHDAENKTNAITIVEVSSSYDEKQNMDTFLGQKENS